MNRIQQESKMSNDFGTMCADCGQYHGLNWGTNNGWKWNSPCPQSLSNEKRFSGLSIVELPYILIAKHGHIIGKEDLAKEYSLQLGKPLLIVALGDDIRRAAQNTPIMNIGGMDLVQSGRSLQVADGFIVMRKAGWSLIKDSENLRDAQRAYKLFNLKPDPNEAA